MELIDRIEPLRARVATWRADGLRVALVPTMGALHRGHLALVELARRAADRVIVSIFVNPLQFGPREDFDRYPRTLDADAARLRAIGAHCLFAPAEAEMYPEGRTGVTRVSVPELSTILCGASRPGLFDGVATVVTKLFAIATPQVAVFGAKDYQQLLLIRRLTRDLNLPIDIIDAPIAREPDGLAMSSRNAYLSAAERAIAPCLYRSLEHAVAALRAGQDSAAAADAAMRELGARGFTPDYVSVRHAGTLQPARPDDRRLIVLAAAWLGATRLIDNLAVDLPAA